MHELLDEPVEVEDPAQPVPLGPVRGEIVFEDVSCGHGRGADVLDGFALTVAPGEVVALAGRCGEPPGDHRDTCGVTATAWPTYHGPRRSLRAVPDDQGAESGSSRPTGHSMCSYIESKGPFERATSTLLFFFLQSFGTA